MAPIKNGSTVNAATEIKSNADAKDKNKSFKVVSLADEVAADVHKTETILVKKLLHWKEYLITEKPEDLPVFIHIQNTPIATSGNHSLIIGKKKSRKTLFLIWLVVQYIRNGGNADDILICDTEQSKKHVWKVRERIYKMTGEWVKIISLRGLNPAERREVIAGAVDENNFKVVVIDGIRDLLSNINDPDQCTGLVTWIEHLTVSKNLSIINVLHQNKTDNNARGHLGSELLNKAEVTIELELDEKANCTIVRCESSREKPFESFAFTHGTEDLPEVVSMPVKGKMMTESDQKKRLQYVFDDGQLKYKEVMAGIMQHFDVGENKAGALKATFERNGWIVKNGKDKSPDTVYKLMATTLNTDHND